MKKIVIKKSKSREHFFNVVAGNGKVIATSEMYSRKSNCKKGIAALMTFFCAGSYLVDMTKTKKQG